MMEEHLIGIGWIGVALLAAVCAYQTRADRNYYPMQRIIWAALGFLGMGAGVTFFTGNAPTTGSRLAFVGVLVLACAYSVWFMRRRNRTPRYLALRLDGSEVAVDREHLRQQAENVTSLVHHGAAPEEWVVGLEEACREWRRKELWKTETLPGQFAARKAAKQTRALREGRQG